MIEVNINSNDNGIATSSTAKPPKGRKQARAPIVLESALVHQYCKMLLQLALSRLLWLPRSGTTALIVFLVVVGRSKYCFAMQQQHQQQRNQNNLSLPSSLMVPNSQDRQQKTKSSVVSRRLLWQESAKLLGGTSLSFLVSSSLPQPAHAARGAAELDLEFYVRDLVGGNKKEGNILPSTPPDIPAPRALTGPLLSLLLNDDCSSTCIPTQALIESLLSNNKSLSSPSLEKKIQDSVVEYREKTSRSFALRAPWNDEHVSDQYYFDLTSYAFWRTAADMIPNYTNREVFVRNLGRTLYQQLQSKNLIRTPAASANSSSSGKQPLQDSLPVVFQVLDLFQSSGYCKGYRIRTQDMDAKSSSNNKNDIVFDEFDEDSLLSGMSVDCLVSIYEPATLGASLQITGEQSRFSPDFVGATLAAIWEDDANGIASTWETLFVDPVYRPNPKDYFPNEQLFQFTLTKKK